MADLKESKKAVKAKRKYSQRTKPSVKTAGPGLREMLKLSALVPPGVELPADLIMTRLVFWSQRLGATPEEFKHRWLPAGRKKPNTPEELTVAIGQLPEGTEKLQAHLLLLMNQPNEWELDYREMAGRGASKLWLEMTKEACQASAVRNRYNLIRNANEALRNIASQNATGRFEQVFVTTELLIKMDRRTGKSTALYDPIYAALLGEGLDNLKICPRCKDLFFAPRVNSTACETCRDAHRKKKQRNAKRADPERK